MKELISIIMLGLGLVCSIGSLAITLISNNPNWFIFGYAVGLLMLLTEHIWNKRSTL